MLGEWHVRKAVEAADLDEYARAEECLRRAVRLAPKYPRALASLASVLGDRHKFAESRDVARAVLAENPRNEVAQAVLADADLELGQYDESEAIVRKLAGKAPSAPILARLARFAELRGQTDTAVRLLSTARDQEAASASSRDAATWYDVRLGDVLFDQGRLDEAEARYRAILKDFPNHHDATANLGKVLAARGKLEPAIAQYEKAVGIAAEPPMLLALGQLQEKAGKAEAARTTFDRLEKTLAKYAEYRRERSLYLADSGRDVDEALVLAIEDFAARPDLFGHDTLAWALHKKGQDEEAARHSAESLRLGTKDARLYYHSGMILKALGRDREAREALAKALEINPHFSIRHADDAREALKALTAK